MPNFDPNMPTEAGMRQLGMTHLMDMVFATRKRPHPIPQAHPELIRQSLDVSSTTHKAYGEIKKHEIRDAADELRTHVNHWAATLGNVPQSQLNAFHARIRKQEEEKLSYVDLEVANANYRETINALQYNYSIQNHLMSMSYEMQQMRDSYQNGLLRAAVPIASNLFNLFNFR